MHRSSLALALPLALALAGSPSAPLAAQAAPAGQALDVVAPDGVKLRATYWAAARPGPGVLLLHMCNSERSAWNTLGPKLAARGLHALAVDYRAFGESGGGPAPTDPAAAAAMVRDLWPGDVDAAVRALRERTGAGAILGAAGGSCGVNQSVRAASRNPEIRALALLAGPVDAQSEAFLVASPWLPVFAAAAHDDAGAVEMTRWAQGFSAHPGNLFREFPDGGHGTDIFRRHAELETAIVDWFVRHLVTAPVARPTTVAASPGPSAALAAELRAPGGAAAVARRVAAARTNGSAFVAPPEGAVNAVGYEMLQAGDTAGAIALFELNVLLRPESANVHDSLADGLAAAGRHAEAAVAARKAISLLPADPAQDDVFQKGIREAATAKLAPPPGG